MPSLPRDLAQVFVEYVAGPERVRQAITGLDPGRLNRAGVDGWSARNVLVHLADIELAAGYALRLVIAGDGDAVLNAVDQDLWKRKLSYIWRDAEAALALFELLRFSNAELLQNVDRDAWTREGRRGGTTVTPADLLRAGAAHVEEHVAQLRSLLGK